MVLAVFGQDNFKFMDAETNFLEARPKEHFNFGHIGMVLMCAAFLISITVMKRGLVLPFVKKEQVATKKYTLADARREVLAENSSRFRGPGGQAPGAEETDSKLVMLDPGFNQGRVAGASTGTLASELELGGAQAVLVSGKLEEIPVKLAPQDNSVAASEYAQAVSSAETDYDSAGALMAIGAQDDKENLVSASKNLKKLIGSLGQAPAPPGLAEFHRLKIFYYGSMKSLADFYLNPGQSGELEEILQLFFAASERLEILKAQAQEKYQIKF